MYIFRLGKLWLFVACAAMAAFIANQNLTEITVSLRPLIAYPLVVPAYQALFSAFLLGVTTSMIFLAAGYLAKSMTVRQVTKKLRKLEAKLVPTPQEPEFSTGGSQELRAKRFDHARDILSVRD